MPGTVVLYPGDPILSAAWQRTAAVGPIAMPPLAKALAQQPAVDLMAQWITRVVDPTGSPNDPPVLTNPGDQRNRQGETVSLDLAATDDDGDSLYFDAAGLPEGLSIDHDSGRISGALSVLGASTVLPAFPTVPRSRW